MATALRPHLDQMLDNALGSAPRLALAAVARLKHNVALLEGRAVVLARREGYDWGRIGKLLRISKQAARRWPGDQPGCSCHTGPFSDRAYSSPSGPTRTPVRAGTLPRGRVAASARSCVRSAYRFPLQ